jgi:hypothetical protein
MKKFELTVADIDTMLASRIANGGQDIKIWESTKALIEGQLFYINQALDLKYNQPRKQGKSQQYVNAVELNKARKEHTFNTLQEWYKTHAADLIASGGGPLSITKIAIYTGLHILTVRNFLKRQDVDLDLGCGKYIAKNVIYIMEKTFSVSV